MTLLHTYFYSAWVGHHDRRLGALLQTTARAFSAQGKKSWEAGHEHFDRAAGSLLTLVRRRGGPDQYSGAARAPAYDNLPEAPVRDRCDRLAGRPGRCGAPGFPDRRPEELFRPHARPDRLSGLDDLPGSVGRQSPDRLRLRPVGPSDRLPEFDDRVGAREPPRRRRVERRLADGVPLPDRRRGRG